MIFLGQLSDYSDTSPVFSPGAIATALVVFAVVILLPLFLRTVSVWRPLRVNAAATGFRGRYRRWSLTHVTGQVLASRRHTETYGGGDFYEGTAWTRTDVFDDLMLRQANGAQTNVQVVNFNVSAFPGQVVSFWTAYKGGRVFTFAVLNYSTGQQNVNQQQLFSIMQARQSLFVLYLIFSVIPIVFLSVFGGRGLPLLLWFVLLVLYALGQRHVRRGFNRSGIARIWSRGQAEASPWFVR